MIRQMMRLAGVLVLFTIAGAMSLSFGQGAQGTLSGTVTDQQGAVVAGATIEVTNVANGEKRSAVTTDDGFYTVPNLAAANYDVTVTGAGFAPSTVKGVKISVAFNTT
ncbi:MAG TPA: carboxypeptidase-like regulatory domain-containing protein, partial [Pyrinomonadaceae bacterium]|nr:carboxypeptidase-like regulatory domain-containing protein [Pyrinomonadaceae bacterium]